MPLPLASVDQGDSAITTASSAGGEPAPSARVEVWHNIMWSTYKAVVFSALARQAQTRALDLHVYQIAETEVGRGVLSPVDASRHDYPMTCLFPGAYSDTPVWTRVGALARHALTTRADTVVLAGYDRPEYIIQAVVLWLRGIPRGGFLRFYRFRSATNLAQDDRQASRAPPVFVRLLLWPPVRGLYGRIGCGPGAPGDRLPGRGAPARL